MRWLSRLVDGCRSLVRRTRIDRERELDDEIRGYAEMLSDEEVARGVSEVEARRRAVAAMGGIEPVKEAVRDVRPGAALAAVGRDARLGVRLLRRSPGFTIAAVASLGLGIGVNTGIFAVLDALLLRPLPVAEPATLVDLYTSSADGDTFSSSSLPDLQDFRAEARAFADLAGYTPMFAAVNAGGRSRIVLGEVVTGNYFQMLGIQARLGRTLLPDDDTPGAPRTVVIAERRWRREHGADPAILGRTIRIRGESFTVVGVIDESFTGMIPMLAPEIWLPVVRVGDIEPAGMNENVPSPTGTSRLDRRGSRWLFAKARLAPGVSADQAHAAAQVVVKQLAASWPQTNKGRRVTIRAAGATRVHPAADGLLSWIVSGTMIAVGLVLLIACANVAGMLLARGTARVKEVSIRLALGAGRLQLVQQLLVESLLLAGAGALVGLGLAWWLMRLLSTIDLPIPVPLSLDLRLDGRVLTFTLLVSVATAVVAGLVPALNATRPDLVSALRGDRQTGRAMGRRWTLRDGLVVGQMAVTTVLLIVAGLLVRSLVAARHADVGFRSTGVAAVSLDTRMLRYSSERSQQFFDEAVRRVGALPGVEGVALASRLPFSINFNSSNIAIPGRQKTDDEMGPAISSASVSPAYFETLGIALLQGRAFSDADAPGKPQVAIVNQTMARRYWPNDTAIGKRVFERTLNSARAFEIVGITADHKMHTVGEAAQPAIYFPSAQRSSGYNNIVARRRGDEQALLADLRRTLLAIEPDLLLIHSQTMPEMLSAMQLPARMGALLVTAFGSLGLLLAAVGLYGVIAFSVARRTREIGIRLAIGARPRSVLAGIMRQGGALAVAGLVAGFLLSAFVAPVLTGMLYGVGAGDPVVWGGAALTLLTVAGLANLLPALRAMRVDPARALRTD